MKGFRWDEEKNLLLKRTRDVSFEEIVVAVHSGYTLHIIEHPNKEKYPRQKIMIVAIDRYAYLVPYVEEEGGTIFLKTIIPSRDATKKYICD